MSGKEPPALPGLPVALSAADVDRIAEAVAAKLRASPPAVAKYISAKDVVASLGISRSKAYEHLRIAANRPVGTRKNLRVSMESWRRYCAKTFDR